MFYLIITNMHQKRKAFKNIEHTGYSAGVKGRLVNKDGTNNLHKRGIPLFKKYSLYHSLLRMPRYKFLLLVFLFYTSINVLFAFIYLAIGVDKLSGVDASGTLFENFTSAFFFSSQTLTTVGYGHVSPSGLVANSVASVESFLGIMTFALVTGMFYARFSRPQAFIRFSDHLLIAPYKGGKAIMFRLATVKNNHLTDVEAQVTASMHVMENGIKVARFFQLPLEIPRINSLALSWTCVHHLNEDSPLGMLTEKELRDGEIELMVTVKAFDDHFSNAVQQRTSYIHHELVYGAKFLPMFRRDENGHRMEVMMNMLNAYEQHVFDEVPVSS